MHVDYTQACNVCMQRYMQGLLSADAGCPNVIRPAFTLASSSYPVKLGKLVTKKTLHRPL